MSHSHTSKSHHMGNHKTSTNKASAKDLKQNSNPPPSTASQPKSSDSSNKNAQNELLKALATIETLKLEKENLKNTLMITLERRIEKENNVDLSSPLSNRSKHANLFTNQSIKAVNEVERENKELKALLERNKAMTLQLQREKEDVLKKSLETRQVEENNRSLKNQLGSLQEQLETISKRGDGLLSPRSDDNDFRQTLLGYFYETTQNLSLLNPDHWARERFNQRFPVEHDLTSLLERKKYREIIMRGYKYINDLIRKISRYDGDTVPTRTLNKRASWESLSPPRSPENIYGSNTNLHRQDYYLQAQRRDGTRKDFLVRDASPDDRYNRVPTKSRPNFDKGRSNNQYANKSFHPGHVSYDMRNMSNVQSPTSQSFSIPHFQSNPFYYPSSQNPIMSQTYSRNNSNATLASYPGGYNTQGNMMVNPGYTPNQNVNRNMYFSTPQTPQNYYPMQQQNSKPYNQPQHYNTMNPADIVRTEESDPYSRNRTNLDRSDPNINFTTNNYDPSFDVNPTTMNTEFSRVDYSTQGSNPFNTYNPTQRRSTRMETQDTRAQSNSTSNPRSPSNRYAQYETSPRGELKRNKWVERIAEEELQMTPRGEMKTSVGVQISPPTTASKHKRAMALPIQGFSTNLNKSQDISKRDDRSKERTSKGINTEEKKRDNSQSFRETTSKGTSFSVVFGRTESGLLPKERKNVFDGNEIPKKKKVDHKVQQYDPIKGKPYVEPSKVVVLRDVSTPKSKKDEDLSSCERA